MLTGVSVSQAPVNGLVEEVLPQGCWSDDDYLWLTDHTGRPVEFSLTNVTTVDVGSVFDAAAGTDSRDRV